MRSSLLASHLSYLFQVMTYLGKTLYAAIICRISLTFLHVSNSRPGSLNWRQLSTENSFPGVTEANCFVGELPIFHPNLPQTTHLPAPSAQNSGYISNWGDATQKQVASPLSLGEIRTEDQWLPPEWFASVSKQRVKQVSWIWPLGCGLTYSALEH